MRLIRRGNVRVNAKRSKPERRLKYGDVVFLPVSLRRGCAHEAPVTAGKKLALSLPKKSVLFEDEDILVLNKPAGVVVHGGSSHHTGLIECLKQQRALPELRLAHRLDRDTSGCLLLAKRLPVLRDLAEAFQHRQAHKTYLAWVRGHLYPYAGRMQAHLAKGVLHGGERMVAHGGQGKHAVTDYQVILQAQYDDWPLTLLALQPQSGRTHQLRVQLQIEGHAILGDRKYAERQDRRTFRRFGGKGMALHAWRLRFKHPGTGKQMEVRAPWPEWWKQCFADTGRFIYTPEQ